MSEEIRISDTVLEGVSGGTQYANGTFVNYGSYIIYTVAPGDVLGGIAARFGVSVEQLVQWNSIKNPDLIFAGQKYTVYPKIIR